MKKILIVFGGLVLCYAQNAAAQTVTESKTDPKTGIRITTRITPLQPEEPRKPTVAELQEQIAKTEVLWANAKQNPADVQSGMAAKYESALQYLRTELAAVEASNKTSDKSSK